MIKLKCLTFLNGVLQLPKYTSLQYNAHLGLINIIGSRSPTCPFIERKTLLQCTRLPGSASWALTESVAAKWCMVPRQQINDSANPNVWITEFS